MWNRSPPMPGNFWSAWKNRMWMKSPGSPQRWPFDRKTPRGTRARTWRRRRKFTITCDCYLRAAGKLFASNAARKSGVIAPTKLRRTYWRSRQGGVFTFCTSSVSQRLRGRQRRSEVRRNLAALLLRNSFARFLRTSLRRCRPRRRCDTELVQNVKTPPWRERQYVRRNFVGAITPDFRAAFDAKSLPAARK